MLSARQSMFFISLIIGAMLAFAYYTGPYQQARLPHHPNFQQATVLSQPRALSPFALKQTDGKSFTEHSLEGQWSLVFFGYTHCPSTCPMTLKMLNDATTEFSKAGVKPQVVFITLDPKVDDAKQIKQYLAHFNSNFVGVTGNDQQIHQLSQQLGITSIKNGQLIDHSGAIIVTDPNGNYHAMFSQPTREGLAHDMPLMMRG